ncbi:MAG: XdhC family protein [Thaumarchaeota archaeon]|nr:XdhC family protein [Nitrososphaerota archaeon]
MDDFYTFVSKKIGEGTRVVVASVIEADGSVPRGQGTNMAIPETGPIWGTVGGGCVEKYIVHAARNLFEVGKTRVEEFNLGDDSWSGIGMSCGGKVKMIMNLVEPPERLILFGAGGIAKGCAQIADMLGYKVLVLDPFATNESFPNAEVISQGVLHKIKEIPITRYDNILILTEHRYDVEALEVVLNSRARFIGMIGSKNRVNESYKDLMKKGVALDKLLTVYAPVGLDIGAISQQEISVSIMAEVIHARRGGSLDHLRLTKLLEKPEKTHVMKSATYQEPLIEKAQP